MTYAQLRRRTRMLNNKNELKELIEFTEDACHKFAILLKSARERDHIARLLASPESITAAERAREKVVVGTEMLAKVLTNRYEACSTSTKKLIKSRDFHDLVGCMLITEMEEEG